MLREPSLGFSICFVLLLATPSPGQSCRGATRLQRVEQAQQELAADEDESDEAPAPAVPIRDAEEEVSATPIEAELPAELEELLTRWEQKCSEIQNLRGSFMRYVYDDVFNVEERASGRFWYEAPHQFRIDFTAVELPDPPVNPNRIGTNGEPFRIESEENQKWIFSAEEAFIIHEDRGLYDYIDSEPWLSTFNSMQLIGKPYMLYEIVTKDHHLSLGEQHCPKGRTVEREGQSPQLHIVAVPMTDAASRNWRRIECLLDGVSFLPRAIRLLDPSMNKETVYVFDVPSMKVNDTSVDPNPFNVRPPRDFQNFLGTRFEDAADRASHD